MLVRVRSTTDGTFQTPITTALRIAGLGGAESAGDATIDVDLGDPHPTEWTWSPNSRNLFVSGDLHRRGAVVAVEAVSGATRKRLVSDSKYTDLCPAPEGRSLFALRNAVDEAPAPVRLDTGQTEQGSVHPGQGGRRHARDVDTLDPSRTVALARHLGSAGPARLR